MHDPTYTSMTQRKINTKPLIAPNVFSWTFKIWWAIKNIFSCTKPLFNFLAPKQIIYLLTFILSFNKPKRHFLLWVYFNFQKTHFLWNAQKRIPRPKARRGWYWVRKKKNVKKKYFWKNISLQIFFLFLRDHMTVSFLEWICIVQLFPFSIKVGFV